MKIAINSLPRSGTKILQGNFQQYLKASGYAVLCPDSFDSIGEPFNFEDYENDLQVTKTGITGIDGKKILFSKKHKNPVPLTEELKTRYVFLTGLKNSWVYKRTPFSNFDPILYESAVGLDKCIAIVKQNTFEHCISFVLARQLDIWSNGDSLRSAIRNYTENKIKIELSDFSHFYKWFKDYNKIKWVKDIQVVRFEEMVKLSNSKEFCDFFHLPDTDFDFHPFVVEYGDNKINMISNMLELSELAKELDKKYA
jgi:hypothetical protein